MMPPLISFSMKAFTVASLRRKSKNSTIPISGRNLYDAGKESWREFKKAVVVANDFLQDGQLSSGKTKEDMFDYVRKGMYAHYYHKKKLLMLMPAQRKT